MIIMNIHHQVHQIVVINLHTLAHHQTAIVHDHVDHQFMMMMMMNGHHTDQHQVHMKQVHILAMVQIVFHYSIHNIHSFLIFAVLYHKLDMLYQMLSDIVNDGKSLKFQAQYLDPCHQHQLILFVYVHYVFYFVRYFFHRVQLNTKHDRLLLANHSVEVCLSLVDV